MNGIQSSPERNNGAVGLLEAKHRSIPGIIEFLFIHVRELALFALVASLTYTPRAHVHRILRVYAGGPIKEMYPLGHATYRDSWNAYG